MKGSDMIQLNDKVIIRDKRIVKEVRVIRILNDSLILQGESGEEYTRKFWEINKLK